ncbi:toll/interleukin-1 receptor domain-containing protein [Spirosoma sp. SC4-14]|uniref:toll/interleukin-1 receptor domain-containing protein n=1 Tax=Spirosoma sp. SC4-14 TaxID=3128900 RepID=UPI0030D0D288
MALITEEQLRARVQSQPVQNRSGDRIYNVHAKAETLLSEARSYQNSTKATQDTFDIFLSHSTKDAELVAGLKLLLEDLGFKVYVDWIEDPQLSRAHVTKNTARVLQGRMRQCKTLIYAFSENSSESRWMPWELGYFDGIKNKVAVMPIAKGSRSDDFKGTEYLGLYYYITIDKIQNSTQEAIWVHESTKVYVAFDNWFKFNSQPYQH